MSIEKFLIKKGIVKSKNQANITMIIIIIICLIYIFSNMFGGSKNKTDYSDFTEEELELMMMEGSGYTPEDEINFELNNNSQDSALNGGYIDL